MKLTQKLRKISAKLFYFLAPLILILLTGCPADPLCITPTNTQASRLTLNFKGGRECERPATVLNAYFLRPEKTKRFATELWTIRATSPGGKLDTLVYGVVPEGFTQLAPPLPISPGNTIIVTATNEFHKEAEAEIILTK
jgi:hypothetical protein